jgi:integration host factor subunit beta
MLKSELLKNITKKYPNFSDAEIKKAIDAILVKMTQGLINNQRIEIRGFGSFSTRERKSTNARNPKTNEKITVTNKKSIHFKYGKELFESVNDKKT